MVYFRIHNIDINDSFSSTFIEFAKLLIVQFEFIHISGIGDVIGSVTLLAVEVMLCISYMY